MHGEDSSGRCPHPSFASPPDPAYIERGEKVVTILTADKLARTLGTTPSEMLAELEREAPDADGG